MPSKKTPEKAPAKAVTKKKTASERSATPVAKNAPRKKPVPQTKGTFKKNATNTESAKKDKQASRPHAPGKTVSNDSSPPPEADKLEGGGWFSGISSGVQEKILKLLNQLSPEVRESLMKHAREQGPKAAMVAIDAAARKTRNPKAKLALRALGGLLGVFVSSDSKK